MTYEGDYSPEEPEVRTYPTVFGVTLTPGVSGVLIAVLGLALAIYAGTQLLVPSFQRYQEHREAVNIKQADLNRKIALLNQGEQIRANLDQAKAQNLQVRALLPSQKSLETLVLDLNRLIVQSNAQLVTFTPDFAASGPVTDSSLGPELNSQLKQQVTNVAFEGTFNQTLDIFRSLDRLQTLLVVKDLTIELQQEGQTPRPGNLLRSAFKLYAYVPLTPEEAAAVAQQQAQQAEPAAEPSPE